MSESNAFFDAAVKFSETREPVSFCLRTEEDFNIFYDCAYPKGVASSYIYDSHDNRMRGETPDRDMDVFMFLLFLGQARQQGDI